MVSADMFTTTITYLKDNFKMGKDRGTAGIFGQMEITGLASGRKMKGMDMGKYSIGMVKSPGKDNGKMEGSLENELNLSTYRISLLD